MWTAPLLMEIVNILKFLLIFIRFLLISAKFLIQGALSTKISFYITWKLLIQYSKINIFRIGDGHD